MQQGLVQGQRMGQEQIMAPQQMQSLEILAMPVMELQQRINQELAGNPTLELEEAGGEILDGDPLAHGAEADPEAAARAVERDESLASIVSSERGNYQAPDSDAEERRRHFFDSFSQGETLEEMLMQQLRTSDLPEHLHPLAEHIIGSLDDAGYLNGGPQPIATALGVDLKTVKEVLTVIQSFDPPGIGACDLQECLLLQLKKRGQQGKLPWKIVAKHADLLAKGDAGKLAKFLKLELVQVQEALAEIRRLTTPWPGLVVSDRNPDFISAEAVIETLEDGSLAARPLRDSMPRLRLSERCLAILEDPRVPAEDKKWIRDKVFASKSLMRALEMRESTLMRLLVIVIREQEAFFREGLAGLKPLTMRGIAEELGVHETTVSRAISGKHVQTPRGLLALRFFFSTGLETSSGSRLSTEAFKQRLQEVILSEDRRTPLGDGDIASLLAAEGLEVSRRTVTKYREELGIGSVPQRRKS